MALVIGVATVLALLGYGGYQGIPVIKPVRNK